jgi:hypothetical protein
MIIACSRFSSAEQTPNPDISPEAVIESAGRRVVIGV